MAWIRVLAMPIRSCYATDSASMVGKAIQLIKAVEEREKQIEQGNKVHTTNPFRKAWGNKLTVICGNRLGLLWYKEGQEINH